MLWYVNEDMWRYMREMLFHQRERSEIEREWERGGVGFERKERDRG